MKSKDIESKNRTDGIRPTTEANLLVEREPIHRPITAGGSVYETPYATDNMGFRESHIHHNLKGSKISFRNSSNDQSRKRKWSLSYLVIGLVIGSMIGATVTGLLMHFIEKPVCVTETPSNSIQSNGESNLQLFIEFLFHVSRRGFIR